VAVTLAHEAGALQMRARAGVTVRATKAHRNDPVSDVDLAGETLIVDGLRRPAPGLVAAAAPGLWADFSAGAAVRRLTAG